MSSYTKLIESRPLLPVCVSIPAILGSSLILLSGIFVFIAESFPVVIFLTVAIALMIGIASPIVGAFVKRKEYQGGLAAVIAFSTWGALGMLLLAAISVYWMTALWHLI